MMKSDADPTSAELALVQNQSTASSGIPIPSNFTAASKLALRHSTLLEVKSSNFSI